MLFDDAQQQFGWPRREVVFPPIGADGDAYSEALRKKLRELLCREFGEIIVNVGLLIEGDDADTTTPPLAIVCEFPRAARQELINKAHALAWNASRSSLLIILEPHRVSAWSCRIDPTRTIEEKLICESSGADEDAVRSLRGMLHWINLVTGKLQQDHSDKFPSQGRVDSLLLKNMRHVRNKLIHELNLDRHFCHDLLARVIFTQFLFDRTDSQGYSFFSERRLRQLKDKNVLRCEKSTSLAGILRSKPDTYRLFRWLDKRFNGDLFPGKAVLDQRGKEAEWEREEDAVQPEHLQLLADLVSGEISATDQQLNLWKQYSFDIIPLELISSIYEDFLDERREEQSAYYTRSHLADYVLDGCLPWNGDEWNLRILDPCCGSGIFLVKAFQRLIHRWKRKHPGVKPRVSHIRPILESNIVGVDMDADAVRVAGFSLYLGMLDAIEPRYYIHRGKQKVFPRLQGERLIVSDFFAEDAKLIRTKEDAGTFDLVLGNAPWGKNRIKKSAQACEWVIRNKWPVVSQDIGPVFLGKASALTRPDGWVGMVNTASILTWRNPTAARLRRLLFTTVTFEEITNLSALRKHDLFPQATGSSCVLIYQKAKPTKNRTFAYACPRFEYPASDGCEMYIAPQYVHFITHAEAESSSTIWASLACGGRRELNLLSKLQKLETLDMLETAGAVVTRRGIVEGDRSLKFPVLKGSKFWAQPEFPSGTFLELDTSTLSEWDDPCVDASDSVKFDAFYGPQLVVKLSYVAQDERWRAAIVHHQLKDRAFICTQAFESIHDTSSDGRHVRRACLAANSKLAVFFLAMSGGSVWNMVQKASVGEILSLPLPALSPDLGTIATWADFDEQVRAAYEMTSAEWILVEDFLEYTWPELRLTSQGASRQRTRRSWLTQSGEADLTAYVQTFLRVFTATLGPETRIGFTIYEEEQLQPCLPVRMITLHLDAEQEKTVELRTMGSDGLMAEIGTFYQAAMQKRQRGFQRVAFIWHNTRQGGKIRRHLTLIKPDERRYWLRSIAMRDADDLLTGALKKAVKPTVTE